MRFVCFGYINEHKWENLPNQEQNEVMQDYFNFYQRLKEENKLMGGIGLKSAKEACRLSLVEHKVDERKLKLDMEQLGGFFFLEADSLEEATTIIAKHPGLKVGAIEIRIVDEEITELVGVN
jgi:hypothetical protein